MHLYMPSLAMNLYTLSKTMGAMTISPPFLVKRVLCICSIAGMPLPLVWEPQNLCEMPLLEVTREVARLWSMPCYRPAIPWNILVFPLSSSSYWNFGLQVMELQIYSGRSAYDACTAQVSIFRSDWRRMDAFVHTLCFIIENDCTVPYLICVFDIATRLP